uniref:Uncharacterized protein n=1 Tax=Rhizophora mucronata TaxID=61149 RepID=A0A2P2IUY1_RHIMU
MLCLDNFLEFTGQRTS